MVESNEKCNGKQQEVLEYENDSKAIEAMVSCRNNCTPWLGHLNVRDNRIIDCGCVIYESESHECYRIHRRFECPVHHPKHAIFRWRHLDKYWFSQSHGEIEHSELCDKIYEIRGDYHDAVVVKLDAARIEKNRNYHRRLIDKNDKWYQLEPVFTEPSKSKLTIIHKDESENDDSDTQ